MTERVRVDRICEITGMSKRQVWALAERGSIPSAINFGTRMWTFREQAVREWLPYYRPDQDPALPAKTGPFGLIYAIQGDPGTPVKIGFSTPKALGRRLLTLQTGNPLRLSIVSQAIGYMRDERRAHAALASDRLAGEWFAWVPRVEAFVSSLRDAGVTAAIAICMSGQGEAQ